MPTIENLQESLQKAIAKFQENEDRILANQTRCNKWQREIDRLTCEIEAFQPQRRPFVWKAVTFVATVVVQVPEESSDEEQFNIAMAELDDLERDEILRELKNGEIRPATREEEDRVLDRSMQD